ncbi:MAG: methylenetetrahydrofolate reductase [Novosphingobium sp.]|nr:methylenetetrahydrofolate reductase [Novosphingobium sp.]
MSPAKTAPGSAVTQASVALLRDYSLEITARDSDQLEEAAPFIPPGTGISITFLPSEDFSSRIDAAVNVRRLGFVPIPHIPARRLKSAAELDHFLDRLATEAAVDRVFVIAGDTGAPNGPFEDALGLIRTGSLARYGVVHVGIAGYPEGHPAIDSGKLWQALIDKSRLLGELGHEYSIVTQFGFDAAPLLEWAATLRSKGVHVPLRAGIAGPTNVKTLLRFAARCGVGASTKVLAKYGISITRLFGTSDPGALVADLAEQIRPDVHGDLRLHVYPFGGLAKSASWMADFKLPQGN